MSRPHRWSSTNPQWFRHRQRCGRGVHLQHARAPRGIRNALDLAEQFSGRFTAINSGTCADEKVLGLRWINDDGKNIRVVDHTLLDAVPGLAAVFGLPRQVPGAGINHVRIHRIDGDGLNVLDLGMVFRRYPFPLMAAITAAVDSVQRAHHQNFRIRRRHAQRTERFAMQVSDDLPGLARIFAAEKIAIAVRYLRIPRSNEHVA